MKSLAVEQCKHNEIFNDLKKQIESSVFKEGDRLPTEVQLAKMFNCSCPTVSKSLNHLQELKLVERVRGSGTYVSRQIKQKHPRKTVAVLIRTRLNDAELAANYYVSQIIVGLQSDYGKNRCNFNLLAMNFEESIESFFERSDIPVNEFDGVIFLSGNLTDEDVAFFKNNSISFVGSSPTPGYEKISYVTIDNPFGIYKATKHLLSLGRKDLRLVSGPISYVMNQERIDGFRRALEEYNIEYKDTMYVETSLTSHKEVYDLAEKMCRDRDESNFDGLIVSREAYRIFKTIQKEGLRIPEDVAFVMYDDIPWVQKILEPSVTAVKQPFVEQAKHMLRMLINKIDSKEEAVVIEILKPELIIRESCGSSLNNDHKEGVL